MSKGNIPTPEELQTLPSQAIVSFAVRCAQRVAPEANPIQNGRYYGSIPSEPHIKAVSNLIDLIASAATIDEILRPIVEKAKMEADEAANAYYKSMLDEAHNYPGSPHDFDGWYDSHHDRGFEFRKSADAAIAAANAALAAKSSLTSTIASAFEAAEAAKSVYITPWYTNSKADGFLAAIQRDFELLRETVQLQRWEEQSTVQQDFFALHSEFDLNKDTRHGTIVQISSVVNEKLLDYYAKYPERLYSLEPRQFEELIGELFDGFGFQVEVTSRTRDGGRDVIAIKQEIVEVKYLIECKRYAKDRTVGIMPVQRLHGVTQAEQATKGILVTTAPAFTKPAIEFLKQQRWVLEGRDFNGLLEWLRQYQELQIRKLRA